MDIRQRDGVEALLNGTPYIIKTSNPEIPAILMMDEKGNINISVLNLQGIQKGNRVQYNGAKDFSISGLNMTLSFHICFSFLLEEAYDKTKY